MSAAIQKQGLVGETIGGRYRVVRQIGRGGMGAIYEVQHLRLRRSFALKTLAPGLAGDKELLARFQREADIIARLRHPNIVDVVDLENLDGNLCIVMELLDGEDLASRLARVGPLDWTSIELFGDQILSALSSAHRCGVVHRDLKPRNVFLARDDSGDERAVLLDFGLSKLTHVDTLATTNTGLIGTPSYMAPEQADGRHEDVGPRTDAWAAGAILFEMATGEPAFEGASVPRILYRICHGEPGQLARHRPDAPPEFVHLVSRVLDRDPRSRLEDIDVVRRGLRAALAAIDCTDAEPTDFWNPPAGPELAERAYHYQAPAEGAVMTPSKSGAEPTAASWEVPAPHRRPAPARRGHLLVTGALTAAVAGALAFTVGAKISERNVSPRPALEAAAPVRDGGELAIVVPRSRPAAGGIVEPGPGAGAEAGGAGRGSAAGTSAGPAASTSTDPDSATAAGAAPRAEPAASRGSIPEQDAGSGEKSSGSRPVEQITLHLTSTPSGARVRRRGRVLGRTPLELRLARSDTVQRFQIEHRGYRPAAVRLSLASDGAEHITLRRRRHRETRAGTSDPSGPDRLPNPFSEKEN